VCVFVCVCGMHVGAEGGRRKEVCVCVASVVSVYFVCVLCVVYGGVCVCVLACVYILALFCTSPGMRTKHAHPTRNGAQRRGPARILNTRVYTNAKVFCMNIYLRWHQNRRRI